MRRCIVESFCKLNKPYDAWFHQWFTDADAQARAIIELDDGKVDTVYATQIRFLTPWGQERAKEEK